jgi:hypothetical protein
MTRPSDRSDRLEQALRLLAEEARERLARHPSGHLAAGAAERLELAVAVPAAVRGVRFGELAGEVDAALDAAVAALVAHRAAFRPGAVFCLRCGGAECAHATPGGPREVFAGYGRTGLPRFLDFAQLLLERGDRRVDRLYDEPPALLAHTVLGRDLAADLLPAYRASAADHRLHGQVAAGWWQVPGEDGRREPLALTFQIASTRPAGGRRRFGVNVLGRAPGGRPLADLLDALGELPWGATVRWAQAEIESIERGEREARDAGPRGGEVGGGAAGGGEARGGAAADTEALRSEAVGFEAGGGENRAAEAGGGEAGEGGGRRRRDARRRAARALDNRLLGVLNGLARRLEKDRRAAERKTHHARERHAQGDRPTDMALADLARAGAEAVLVDRRQDTLVVLGDRGRTHVFSAQGKHVTSVRYPPETIERRRQRDLWRPAAPEEVAALRARVAGAGSAS